MPRLLKNKQEIARDQNVSRQTVHSWMSDPRWNLGQEFPIDGEKIESWRAETLSTSATAALSPSVDNYAATRRRVDLQHKAEQTLYLRLRRGILEKTYVERSFAERTMVGLTLDYFNRIEMWIDTLPTVFAHQSEEQIRERFNDAYDQMREDMAANLELPLADEEQVQEFKNKAKSNAAYRSHRGF
ncbi:MAG: hypothetical protein AABZ47_15370 [Planctomycetota bacterium]